MNAKELLQAEETSTWDRKHAAEDIAEAIRAITIPAPTQEGETNADL